MPDTTAETTGTEQSGDGTESQRLGIEQIGNTLDGWRSKIDELIVQLDLGNLEMREEVRRRLDITQNVYLAARSRLSDARRDADTNLSSLRLALDQLLRDLQAAYDAAEAVVRRSRDRS